MRIRLRRGELAIIAITLMFACFIGGYFTGRRGAVNVVSVPPPGNSGQSASIDQAQGTGDETAGANTAAANSSASSGAEEGTEAAATDGANTANPGDAFPATETTEQPQETPGALRDSDGKININTATRSELMDLTGVGEVIAGRIVDYRESNGPFSTIEDLMKVSGIGEKRFEAIQDRITVG